MSFPHFCRHNTWILIFVINLKENRNNIVVTIDYSGKKAVGTRCANWTRFSSDLKTNVYGDDSPSRLLSHINFSVSGFYFISNIVCCFLKVLFHVLF